MQAKFEIVAPYREALAALTAAMLNPRNELSVLHPQTEVIRRSVQGVLDAVIHGAHAASKNVGLASDEAASLRRALYSLHLALMLLWSQDRSRNTQAAYAALDLVRDLLALSEPLFALPQASEALGRLDTVFKPLLEPFANEQEQEREVTDHAVRILQSLFHHRRLRGLVIFLFLFAFGDLINCLTDRDLDAVYKPHLTEAVFGIGLRGVVLQAAFSGVAAILLTMHLAWLLDRWLLAPLVIVGLAVAASYSIEPVRLKGKGLWQLVFYWFGLFTGPMLFAALLFTPTPEPPIVAVCLAFGMTQTGVILLNTAEDFPEDRQSGVRTVIVALGIYRGIALAVVLTAVGAAALTATLAWKCAAQSAELFAWLSLLIVFGSGLGACVSLERLRRRIVEVNESEAAVLVKQFAVWTPVWISAIALSTLIAAGAIFWSRLQQ